MSPSKACVNRVAVVFVSLALGMLILPALAQANVITIPDTQWTFAAYGGPGGTASDVADRWMDGCTMVQLQR